MQNFENIISIKCNDLSIIRDSLALSCKYLLDINHQELVAKYSYMEKIIEWIYFSLDNNSEIVFTFSKSKDLRKVEIK